MEQRVFSWPNKVKIQFAILVIIFRCFEHEKLEENLAQLKKGLLSCEAKNEDFKTKSFSFFPARLHFGTETLSKVGR